MLSDATNKRLVSKIYKQLMQLKNNKNPTKKKKKKKMGRRSKKTFLQRRHIDGQEAHEKMLNIAKY